MLSDQQLRDLISQGESSTIEFKSQITRPDFLAKLISAFANAEGGYILLGVGPRGEIIGCNSAATLRLYEDASRHLKDASSGSLHFHPLDGREVAVIRVAKAPGIVSTREGVFVRRGEAITAMSPEELRLRFKPHANPQIAELFELVTELTRSNEGLHTAITEANSLKSKFKDYIIGGIIGALISALTALVAT